jgi:hypothetical protein
MMKKMEMKKETNCVICGTLYRLKGLMMATVYGVSFSLTSMILEETFFHIPNIASTNYRKMDERCQC